MGKLQQRAARVKDRLIADMVERGARLAAEQAERDTAGRVRAHVAEEIAEAIEQGPSCGCVSCRLNMAALARRHARVPAPSVIEAPCRCGGHLPCRAPDHQANLDANRQVADALGVDPGQRQLAERWVHAPTGDLCLHKVAPVGVSERGRRYCLAGEQLARPGYALHPDEPHSADGPGQCLGCFLMLGERAAAKAGYRPDGLRIGDEHHPDEPHRDGGPVGCMWCRLLTPGASTGTLTYAEPETAPMPPGWGIMVAEQEEPVAVMPYVHWLALDGDQASPACGYVPDPPHTVTSVTDPARVDCPDCRVLPGYVAEAASREGL